MTYILEQKQIEEIEQVLSKSLIDLGVHSVILIDMAGNIVVDQDSGNSDHDIYSLAALAAGNYGAMNAMANIVGEDEFSLLFHKGETANIHFSKILSDYLLVSIFGKEISLGFLRLKVAEAVAKIEKLLPTQSA
ncbi:MAG: roadblock/LC7 domain-containing protein [Deltaproteobacteria bacterium]|nr:MAG: roadblock/LC7 domain-containing protein [Deltaproteobacteria bacterium]